MTTDVIADPASLERQRLLLGAFEAWAGEASLQEQAEREHGHHEHAACRGALRRSAEAYATLIRDRLVAASALTEDDVDAAPDAPPPSSPEQPAAPIAAVTDRRELDRFPWLVDGLAAVADWSVWRHLAKLCRRVLVVHARMTTGWWPR